MRLEFGCRLINLLRNQTFLPRCVIENLPCPCHSGLLGAGPPGRPKLLRNGGPPQALIIGGVDPYVREAVTYGRKKVPDATKWDTSSSRVLKRELWSGSSYSVGRSSGNTEYSVPMLLVRGANLSRHESRSNRRARGRQLHLRPLNRRACIGFRYSRTPTNLLSRPLQSESPFHPPTPNGQHQS
jgi:hypothetical protein